jgi:hypothetical protein
VAPRAKRRANLLQQWLVGSGKENRDFSSRHAIAIDAIFSFFAYKVAGGWNSDQCFGDLQGWRVRLLGG